MRESVGKATALAMGPDIAVIELPPCNELNTLINKKSFWNLANKNEENITAALDTIGCMAIVGHAEEDLKEDVGPIAGFKEVTFSPDFMGLTGQTEYFECAELDYLGVSSKRTKENGAPASYSGISGGSIWRVPIMRKPDDDPNDHSKLFPGRITLAGVPFWQFPEENGVIPIRGHGPKTIYRALLKKLVENG